MAARHGVLLHIGRIHPSAVGPRRNCDPGAPGARPVNMIQATVASSRPEERETGLAVETAATKGKASAQNGEKRGTDTQKDENQPATLPSRPIKLSTITQ